MSVAISDGGLTPVLLALMDCEKAIEHGLADAAYSLRKIRDDRLYREKFSTFEDYCQERWGMSRAHAYRVLDFAEIREQLSPIGDNAPERESQVRPLKALPDPESRAEAWNDAVERADGEQPTAKQVQEAVDDILDGPGDDEDPPCPPEPVPEPASEVEPKPEWRPSKPDLGDGISHPARYSAELIDLFRVLLAEYGIPGDNILDPFAGPGGIHALQADGWETVGIEIEPEWADLHPDTKVGSALDLPFDQDTFGAIVTSPTYGNRLADSHDATDPERRRSYTHDLGRKLDPDNSGDIHWRTTAPGDEGHGSGDYRAFHESAWSEAVRVLAPGGLFILNCCDHVRDGLTQPVTAWHCWALGRLGLIYVESRSVPTRKLRQGANGNLREQEQVHVFRLPSFTGAESR